MGPGENHLWVQVRELQERTSLNGGAVVLILIWVVTEGQQTLSLRGVHGGVHGGVAAQVAARDEGLAAGGTPELFTVGVDAHVDLEGARLSEAFATVDAAVALLARVDALVAFQVAGVGEAFPTQRADERLLARVDPHVGVEVLQGGQSFTAAVAHKRSGAPTGTRTPAGGVLVPPALPPGGRVGPVCCRLPHRKLWPVRG